MVANATFSLFKMHLNLRFYVFSKEDLIYLFKRLPELTAFVSFPVFLCMRGLKLGAGPVIYFCLAEEDKKFRRGDKKFRRSKKSLQREKF